MRIGGGIEKIGFVVDAENKIRELNENNNIIEMTI
jgi:subtilase family serine protease